MTRKKNSKTTAVAPVPRKPGWPKGRARIPEARRLAAGRRVEVSFLEADFARVRAAANQSGKLLAEFIRETVLAAT